jgi:three-Cys-motif partner protein
VPADFPGTCFDIDTWSALVSQSRPSEVCATRRKYRENRPAFIDVFCGPGRSFGTGEYIDGSSVTAFKQGKHSVEHFATIEVSDLEPELLAAATTHLQKLEAPVRANPGPAVEAIANIVSSLNRYGLHFALLDPHNLGALSFSIIEQLAELKYVDILVHVQISIRRRCNGNSTS